MIRIIKPMSLSVAILSMLSCNTNNHETAADGVPEAVSFGKLPDGGEALLYTLSNGRGMVAKVSDFGATLVSLEVPDKYGKAADVTHGYDSVAGYAGTKNPYFGASVGRFGNRIAHGKFSLDGKEHSLATNNSPGGIPCHLHGGDKGFNKRMWEVVKRPSPESITFGYVSPDGEEGYPGTVTAAITYTLTKDNELIWEATATTTAATVINLVHHTYWNLSGDPSSTVNGHELTLFADRYLPTDAGLIPTGELAPVAGTPMDFTAPHLIGERVGEPFPALQLAGGYDHCWVLTEPKPDGLALAARLRDPLSGRIMEVSTNQPAIQFYGGNFLNPGDFAGDFQPGKMGAKYPHRSALCLETENFPDAPNQASFPGAVLRPGETYRHVMVHAFTND
ncbi:galactose mutarotase [Akkermansiaceae bacterium]|nr:galactose mutarotase [Akkermansiaceae bacterium]